MTTVTCIIKERMTQLFHMHPYLVCPSRLQPALYKGDIAKPFEHCIVGDSCFTIITIGEDSHHQPVLGVTTDIALDGAAIFSHVSPDKSNVESFRLFPVKLC